MNTGFYNQLNNYDIELISDLNTNELLISFIKNGIKTTKKLKLDFNSFRNHINKIGFETLKEYKKSTDGKDNDFYSNKLENTNIPPLNFIYYKFLYDNLRIPTLQEFIDAYIVFFCEKSKSGLKFKKEFFDGNFIIKKETQLHGRLFRAFNSFHREIDLFLQVKNFKDIFPKWSYKMDYKEGVDCIFLYHGIPIAYCSYLNNKRSNNYKQKKNTNRHDYSKFEKVINFTATLNTDSTEDYNGVRLHNSQLVKKILEKELKNY